MTTSARGTWNFRDLVKLHFALAEGDGDKGENGEDVESALVALFEQGQEVSAGASRASSSI